MCRQQNLGLEWYVILILMFVTRCALLLRLLTASYCVVDMPFYQELQIEIHKAMGNERKHFKATASHLLQYIITFAVMIVSMNSWMEGSTGAGFVMGLMIWFCSGDILHASTHYAVFTNANANLLLGWSCGWMHHVPSMWIRQHVLGLSALILSLYAAFHLSCCILFRAPCVYKRAWS